jgi:cytochrome bd-type quinol oxidase subunit 2
MQGLTVGRLVEGLPVANGYYIGGDLGWLSPFAALCGVGLCIGYSLLGACWLVRKCHDDVHDFAYRLIPPPFLTAPVERHQKPMETAKAESFAVRTPPFPELT